jgi:hypothetical protein
VAREFEIENIRVRLPPNGVDILRHPVNRRVKTWDGSAAAEPPNSGPHCERLPAFLPSNSDRRIAHRRDTAQQKFRPPRNTVAPSECGGECVLNHGWTRIGTDWHGLGCVERPGCLRLVGAPVDLHFDNHGFWWVVVGARFCYRAGDWFRPPTGLRLGWNLALPEMRWHRLNVVVNAFFNHGWTRIGTDWVERRRDSWLAAALVGLEFCPGWGRRWLAKRDSCGGSGLLLFDESKAILQMASGVVSAHRDEHV